MIVGELIALLKLDKSGFEAGLSDSQKSINKAADNLKTIGKNMSLFITTPLLAIGAAITKNTSDMEMMTAAYTTMLGSSEKANDLLKQMADMAALTPYRFEDFAEAGKLMLNFGIDVENIMPYVSMLGEVAGGNAEKFQRLALVFSQVMATGRLMGQDLLQLINAGFNPLQVISEKTGKSMAQLKKEMEQGAISADMVVQAFRDVTSEGGRFYNGMDRASQTFQGLWSTLQDDLAALGRTFGEIFLPILKDALRFLDGIVKGFMDLDYGTRQLIVTFAAVLAGTGPLIGALGALFALFASNPITLIVAGLALLTAGIVSAVVTISDMADVNKNLNAKTSDLVKVLADYDSINKQLNDSTKNLTKSERETLEQRRELLKLKLQEELGEDIEAIDKAGKKWDEYKNKITKAQMEIYQVQQDQKSGAMEYSLAQARIKDLNKEIDNWKLKQAEIDNSRNAAIISMAKALNAGQLELYQIQDLNSAIAGQVKVKADQLKQEEELAKKKEEADKKEKERLAFAQKQKEITEEFQKERGKDVNAELKALDDKYAKYRAYVKDKTAVDQWYEEEKKKILEKGKSDEKKTEEAALEEFRRMNMTAREIEIDDLNKRFEVFRKYVKDKESVEKLYTQEREEIDKKYSAQQQEASNETMKIVEKMQQQKMAALQAETDAAKEAIEKQKQFYADLAEQVSVMWNSFGDLMVAYFAYAQSSQDNMWTAQDEAMQDFEAANRDELEQKIYSLNYEKEKYLAAGIDKNKVDKWYQEQLAKLRDSATDDELKRIDEILKEQEAAAEEDYKQKRKIEMQKYKLEVDQFNWNKLTSAIDVGIKTYQASMAAYAQLGPIAGSIAAAVIAGLGLAAEAFILSREAPPPPAFKLGGWVDGETGIDAINARLTKGEFVVNRDSAMKYADELEQINSGRFEQSGGSVIISPSVIQLVMPDGRLIAQADLDYITDQSDRGNIRINPKVVKSNI